MSHHVIHYSVDGESQETTEKTLTAAKIVELAGLDPSLRYLIELHGKDQESFEGRMDTVIHMHEMQKFITAATGPTTTS